VRCRRRACCRWESYIPNVKDPTVKITPAILVVIAVVGGQQ
jgi:hypothetical protein